MTRSTRILMVCMGNVCRSPTAEVVLRHRTAQAGIGDQVQVDSAGTHASNNAARPPDERSVAHAARRGYDLRAVRARRVVAEDFERFDLIIVGAGGAGAVLAARLSEDGRRKFAAVSTALVLHTTRPAPW